MDYNIVRDISWKCLIECGISELPIKPVMISKYYDIMCRTANNQILKGASGIIIPYNGKLCIFINGDDLVQRQRFTIMHELGHYVLGHLGDDPLSRKIYSKRPIEESYADKFAAEMLMPACVLWGLNIQSAKEIAEICNVSIRAAEIRMERLKILYQRDMFLKHPLEKKVYRQFKKFINMKNNFKERLT